MSPLTATPATVARVALSPVRCRHCRQPIVVSGELGAWVHAESGERECGTVVVAVDGL